MGVFTHDYRKAVLVLYADENGPSEETVKSYGVNMNALKDKTGQDLLTAAAAERKRLQDTIVKLKRIDIPVQYNPSSISFLGSKKDLPIKKMTDNFVSDIPHQTNNKASLVFQTTLIFEDIDRRDAFMYDNVSLTAKDVVTDIGGAAARKMGLLGPKKTEYSVADAANGIVAMLLSPVTRQVGFHWGELSFDGVVKQASVNYTMFNKVGNPILAEVQLEIVQEIARQEAKIYWNNAFTKVFSGDVDSAQFGGKSDAQSASNILNLDFL